MAPSTCFVIRSNNHNLCGIIFLEKNQEVYIQIRVYRAIKRESKEKYQTTKINRYVLYCRPSSSFSLFASHQ